MAKYHRYLYTEPPKLCLLGLQILCPINNSIWLHMDKCTNHQTEEEEGCVLLCDAWVTVHQLGHTCLKIDDDAETRGKKWMYEI